MVIYKLYDKNFRLVDFDTDLNRLHAHAACLLDVKDLDIRVASKDTSWHVIKDFELKFIIVKCEISFT